MMKDIVIKGAREHNLKISISLFRAINLLYLRGFPGAENPASRSIRSMPKAAAVCGELSSYARQFLGQMEKPDIDSIDGLSPAISIDQKSTSHNPRSTVGTVTEIHDYLRLLYARCGIPHCPDCGKSIERQTIDQVVARVLTLPEGTKAQIVAPCVRGRKGEHQKLFDELKREGYVRVRVDGTVYDLADVPALDKKFKHNIDAVIDRVVIRPDLEGRLTDSLETAFRLGNGLAIVAVVDGEEILFSQNYACPDCGTSMEELTPRMFSFNNPFGACPTCSGLGTLLKIDPDLVIPDRTLSLAQGCVNVMGWNSGSKGTIASMYFDALTKHYGVSMKTPFEDLPEEVQNAILYGTARKSCISPTKKSLAAGRSTRRSKASRRIWSALPRAPANTASRRSSAS
jgi:excinuclease ABC subunit A